MTTGLPSIPSAMCAKSFIAATAFFLLALPRIGASSSLVVIDSNVIVNNDENCFPTVWTPWNGWTCTQDRTAHNGFFPLSNTGFEIRSFASVGASGFGLVPAESWVNHSYRHQWRVGLDGPVGSQGNVWLDAITNGVVSTYAYGAAIGTVQASVGLRLWQGEFSGWGADGPMLADGTYAEANLDRRWGQRFVTTIIGDKSDDLTERLHELTEFTLTAGDPATDIWIEAFLYTYADAVKVPGPTGSLGRSGSEVDLWNGDKGFRYSLTLVSMAPEPGTLALLGLGLTGLALSRRRKAA